MVQIRSILIPQKDGEIEAICDKPSIMAVWRRIFTTTLLLNLCIIIPYFIFLSLYADGCSTNVFIIICPFLQLLINIILVSAAQTSGLFKGFVTTMQIVGLALAITGIVVVGLVLTNLEQDSKICGSFMTYAVGGYCIIFIIANAAGFVTTKRRKKNFDEKSIPVATSTDV